MKYTGVRRNDCNVQGYKRRVVVRPAINVEAPTAAPPPGVEPPVPVERRAAERHEQLVVAEQAGPRSRDLRVALYPIVTFQYSSTNLYQVSYHIQ